MLATTEASPPPQKLSRYRTIRGRNVPESRRYVEPEQKRAARDDRNSRGKPSPIPKLPRSPLEVPSHSLSATSNTTAPLLSPRSADEGLCIYAAANVAGTMSVEEAAQRDADAEMLLAEQKRKDLERLQLQLENHQPASPPPRNTARDKFSFLSRRRGQQAVTREDSAPLVASMAFTGAPKPPRLSADVPVAMLPQAPTTKDQDTSQQRDASSAPDSGAAREVIVRFRQFSSKIAVHSSTTVADILRSCPRFFPCDGNTDTISLVENYAPLGLERRLRRYENIRDIMNTWDRDTDNTLTVDVSTTGASDRANPETRGAHNINTTASSMTVNGDLDLFSVSRDQNTPPSGIAFIQMYHSQKPGRWSKRFISLVGETGLVIASKKADAGRLASLSTSEHSTGNGSSSSGSSIGKDFQSLCHLSDYDIYCPTETEMRKHIKPPKKFCFAVKSQQRTTVFVNTENYVRFFCIDDPVLAREFYRQIFAWRSWYLVNRKLALAATNGQRQRQPVNKLDARQLLDMNFRVGGSDNNHSTQRMMNGNEFAVGSLLGSTYDNRKNAEAAKQSESIVTSRMGPFTDGSLLDNEHPVAAASTAAIQSSTAASTTAATTRHEPSSWLLSATDHSVRCHDQPSRRPTASSRPSSSSSASQQTSAYFAAGSTVAKSPPASVHQGRQQHADCESSMVHQHTVHRPASHTSSSRYEQQQHLRRPAPLVDLTPKFQEAPQWSKENRGHGVRAPPGTTHLVDLAKNVGNDETMPSSTALFRRDGSDSTRPTRYRTVRAQTMTSASAVAATSFARSHHTIHHSSRTNDHPALPLRSRGPPPSSTHDATDHL